MLSFRISLKASLSLCPWAKHLTHITRHIKRHINPGYDKKFLWAVPSPAVSSSKSLSFPGSVFPLGPLLTDGCSSFTPRPWRYQTQLCSAWLRPPTSRPQPNPVPCHTGTSSSLASRGRRSCLCHAGTCCSAPSPILARPSLTGASRLPSPQTSPGRVCRCLENQTLAAARVAGGSNRVSVVRWPRWPI